MSHAEAGAWGSVAVDRAPLLVKRLNSRVVLRPQPSLPDRRATGPPGLSVSLIPLYIRVP